MYQYIHTSKSMNTIPSLDELGISSSDEEMEVVMVKRDNFGKLPMDLINKISDINDPKHLPNEIVINTEIVVTCSNIFDIPLKHTFYIVHEDKVLKRIMPDGFVETYLREFRGGSAFERMKPEYNIKSYPVLYDEERDAVIERYEASGNRFKNNGQSQRVSIERCEDLRNMYGDHFAEFNKGTNSSYKREIMGMRCVKVKRRREIRESNMVSILESYYQPIKKEKVNVSKELSVYNFKF